MKRSMRIKYIFSLSIIALMVSCNFLDEYSQDQMRPTSTEDFDAILVTEAYTPATVDNPIAFLDVLTDDTGTAPFEYVPGLGEVYPSELEAVEKSEPFFTWDRDMFELTTALVNPWQDIYALIMPCNVVLANVEGSIGSDEAKGYLKAQALTLRAMYYYYLVNMFGDPYYDNPNKNQGGVPIIDSYNVTDKNPHRNTVKEVYDFMLKDCMEAIPLFQQYQPDASMTHNRRVNLSSIYGLLVRIYMQMHDYDKAEEYCREVMKINSHLDDLNIEGMVRPYSYEGDMKEVLFTHFTGESLNATKSIKAFFPDRSVVNVDGRNYSPVVRAYRVSSELIDLYDYEYDKDNSSILDITGGDLRAYLYYFTNSTKGTYEDTPNPLASYHHFGVKNHNSSSYNAIGMRTSEIYLSLAEILIRKGENSEAFNLLNELRRHRIMTKDYVDEPIKASMEENLEFCLEERRRELAFECVRWFDLRRLGRPAMSKDIAYSNNITTIEQGDLRYTLPIPEDAMDKNEHLLQNPY